MSHKTVYTCDRCRKRPPARTGIHSCDFGKDYSSATSPDERIILDLCDPCWVLLLKDLGVKRTPQLKPQR